MEVRRFPERRAATDPFRLKERLEAIISPEASAKAGTYIVTLKSEGEAPSESHRTHLVVGFEPQRAS